MLVWTKTGASDGVGVQAGLIDQAFDEGELPAFGVQCAREDDGLGHGAS
jgi:hypothetical protein